MVVVPNLLPYDLVCAVAVLGETHLLRLRDMAVAYLARGFRLAQRFQRTVGLRLPEARFRSVNWNFMPPSGGSLVHPHMQLVAGDRPYRYWATLRAAAGAYRERTGGDFWPDLVAAERETGARLVGTTGPWTWLTAFAPRSRFFEVMAVHARGASFEHLAETDFDPLAEGLVRVLGFLESLGFWAFNLVVFGEELGGAASADASRGFRVQLRISPRLVVLPAGMNDMSFVVYQGEFLAFYRPEVIAASLRPHFAETSAALGATERPGGADNSESEAGPRRGERPGGAAPAAPEPRGAWGLSGGRAAPRPPDSK
jgi:galactose-1-phosphate uridylyltransferase